MYVDIFLLLFLNKAKNIFAVIIFHAFDRGWVSLYEHILVAKAVTGLIWWYYCLYESIESNKLHCFALTNKDCFSFDAASLITSTGSFGRCLLLECLHYMTLCIYSNKMIWSCVCVGTLIWLTLASLRLFISHIIESLWAFFIVCES